MINDNEVVPEGATHKDPNSYAIKWAKQLDDTTFMCWLNGVWRTMPKDSPWMQRGHYADLIPLHVSGHESPSLKDWDDRYPSVNDDVNHPKHYQLGGGLEAIDVIRASLTDEEYRGYLKGNVLKYRLRAGAKGDVQKDIAKADWYKKELDK